MTVTRTDLFNAYRLAELLEEKIKTQTIVGANVTVTIRMDTKLVGDLAASIRALADLSVAAGDSAKADAKELSTAAIHAVLIDESFGKLLRLAFMLRFVRFCRRALERRKQMKSWPNIIALAFVAAYFVLLFSDVVWHLFGAPWGK